MPGQPKIANEGGVEGTQEEGQRGERTWFDREGNGGREGRKCAKSETPKGLGTSGGHPAELPSAQVSSEPSPILPQSRPHFTNYPGLRRQQYGVGPSPWSEFEKVTEASGQ